MYAPIATDAMANVSVVVPVAELLMLPQQTLLHSIWVLQTTLTIR